MAKASSSYPEAISVVVALGQRLNSYLVQTIVRWLIIGDKWHSRLAEIETGQQTTPDIA
jgi:hypothetical protein